MAHPEVDRNHCYECGGDEVEYASLYPLGPISGFGSSRFVTADTDEFKPNSMKFNVDYNVCADCYIEQRQRRYPDDPVPAKVFYRKELKALKMKYQLEG